MKQILLLLVFIMASFSSTQAQEDYRPMVVEGRQWVYENCSYGLSGDTLINGSKYIKMYSDPDITEEELFDTFDEECRKLGFIMDCGKMIEAMYGKQALNNASDLKKVIDTRDEVTVLGSGIFSYWRYVTHWSYNEHLTDEENRKWMLTALNRLYFLTNKA